jgi:hypothetical protein
VHPLAARPVMVSASEERRCSTAFTTALGRSVVPVRPGPSWPGRAIHRSGPSIPWAVLALVLSGLLGGLLTHTIGSALAPTGTLLVRPMVECSGFASEGQPPSFGAIRLSTPAATGAVLDLYFLDARGTVLRMQHAELIAGAQMSFGMPTQEMGSTIRVVGSEAVEVQVTVGSSASGGVSERRPLVCSRLS